MSLRRRLTGSAGERVAAAVLESHGVQVLARNVVVSGGEVDLLALDKSSRVVVEVRTVTGATQDPLVAFDTTKAAQVARLATELGADRVDLVAVRLDAVAAEVRWVRGAA